MIGSPDDPTPTVLGVLTLSRKPQDFIPGARIQFLRIQGISWGGPVIDELRIDGTLAKQLEQLDQKLSSHNRVQVDFSSSPTEIRHYRYPIAALQQLTRNAVMHRSYEGTNAPIMVYWFDDRIEIINAGGPYGSVTAENFGKPGFADYRNPNIAEIAKRLGKSKSSRYLNELVVHLLQKGFVEYTIPGKPNSRLQKYRITAKGTSNR